MQHNFDITSPSNPKIKWLRSLHKASERRDQGVIIVEGAKEIAYAVEGGLQLQALFIAPDIHRDITATPEAGITYTISNACFDRVAYRSGSDGLIGVFAQPRPRLEDLELSDNPLLLVIEAIEKPGNLGAILRVADGVGADGVIICDEHTDLWNPNAIRASVGTIFSTPTAVAGNQEVYDFLQDHRITAYAAELTERAVPYTSTNLAESVAIVLGTEHDGVSDFWLQRAAHISLPQRGKNSSLNVSTATAVLAYEALRQREAA